MDTATLLEADLSASENAIMVERQELSKILSEQGVGRVRHRLVRYRRQGRFFNWSPGARHGAFISRGQPIHAGGKNHEHRNQSCLWGNNHGRYPCQSATVRPGAFPGKIDGVLASHRDVLLAKQETPEQRLQRLRGLVTKGELPTVSLTLTERDYTQASIDPAAETELTLLLEQLGFKVLQPGQGQKPADIAITGEAFSETGSFHGNLVSCRARIELKMTRGATQDIIAVDRETQVAVAGGARTAGKDALQKAADKLIERILPKLVK